MSGPNDLVKIAWRKPIVVEILGEDQCPAVDVFRLMIMRLILKGTLKGQLETTLENSCSEIINVVVANVRSSLVH